MKKVLMILVFSLFILVSISFVSSADSAKGYCQQMGYKYDNGSCVFKDKTQCDAEGFYNGNCGQDKVLYKSTAQIKNGFEKENILKIQEREMLRIYQNESECPNNCSCFGSTTKCQLQNGREMTIEAGKSGNIIVQVKEDKFFTNVTLYKSENGTLYRITKNNETKEIKYTPDLIRERIREKIKAKIENYTSELDENGTYQVQIEKKAKFIGLFPIREKVRIELNSETGEIIRTRTSWWGFLTRDEIDPIMGASCGTVTPGQNDACCMNKGFARWNAENSQCEA